MKAMRIIREKIFCMLLPCNYGLFFDFITQQTATVKGEEAGCSKAK
jgi:hypothetical protein